MNNFARVVRIGNHRKGRIGTHGHGDRNPDPFRRLGELKVKIHPVTTPPSSSSMAPSLGVYSTQCTGVGDVLGRLRFERIRQQPAVGHSLYFDT
jgi:hypothetical protein